MVSGLFPGMLLRMIKLFFILESIPVILRLRTWHHKQLYAKLGCLHDKKLKPRSHFLDHLEDISLSLIFELTRVEPLSVLYLALNWMCLSLVTIIVLFKIILKTFWEIWVKKLNGKIQTSPQIPNSLNRVYNN